MIQAQATARKRLNEIFNGPRERLDSITLAELLTLRRKAKKDDYIISMADQIKIEVAYETVFLPSSRKKSITKDRRRVK